MTLRPPPSPAVRHALPVVLAALAVTGAAALLGGWLAGGWGAALALGEAVAMLALARRWPARGAGAAADRPRQPEAAPPPPAPALPDIPAFPAIPAFPVADAPAGAIDLAALARYLDTLRGQIAGVQGDAEAGVMDIIGQASRLNGGSAEQQARLSRSMADGEALLRAAARPDDIIRSLTAILDRRANDAARNHERLEALAESTARLRPAADAIAKISDRAVLLSFNAAVEAGRAGAAGGSFGVVADQVRALAESIASVAKTLGGELDLIARQMRDELLAARPDSGSGDADVARLMAELGALHDEVNRSGHTLLELIREAGSGHAQLTEGLAHILGAVQFHDIIRQRLDHVVEALDELEAHLAAPDAADGPTLDARLDALRARYVMESERLAHAVPAAPADAPEPAMPRIQLF